jgi:hypothetical protein
MMDDQLRGDVALLVFELFTMYGDPNCVCGCEPVEHELVRHDGGEWITPCRNCLPCREYREPVTRND